VKFISGPLAGFVLFAGLYSANFGGGSDEEIGMNLGSYGFGGSCFRFGQPRNRAAGTLKSMVVPGAHPANISARLGIIRDRKTLNRLGACRPPDQACATKPSLMSQQRNLSLVTIS